MPPQRTFPPVKPLKTERTHEENQERAYIAASRRSDRSLEARVESARRASEIHKRRTGRSLRVTEQDVINEEMYEEEDDDIPSQYRRLTAHLQTGSAEFNRRLQTYLANHVAMRTALNDAIHNNFSQHYPNAPNFAHNSGMYPSPLTAQQGYPQMEPVRSPVAPSPHTPHTPHAYRSVPYTVPGKQGFRGQQQQQQQQPAAGSVSMRTQHAMRPPASGSNPPTPGSERPFEIRRMSMPITKNERPDFQSSQKPASPHSDNAEHADSRSDSGLTRARSTDADRELHSSSELYSGELQQQQRSRPGNLPNFPPSNPFSPFSMALPMESQQMINQAALPQNDFGAALMGGSENWMFDSGLGASNAGEMLKPDSNFYPNTIGMSSTLLSDYPATAPTTSMSDKAETGGTTAAQGLDFGQFLDFSGSNSSNAASGAGTPADDSQAWKELIDPSWVEGSGVA